MSKSQDSAGEARSGVDQEVLARALAGDQDAFGQLVLPYRRELGLHCYRILGSAQDAEDAIQDTLITTWQRLHSFEGRAPMRAWLYRAATNRCLDMLRSRRRRTMADEVLDPEVPEPSQLGEVLWLEPYPDSLMEGVIDSAPGPEARYEAKESVSLAFVTALQLLPPRQRAVLILRDVMGFRATEAARMLETTEESVTSALKRARATLKTRYSVDDREPPPMARSETEREIVRRFVDAFESQDVRAIVELLTDDVRLSMPPLPFEYLGKQRATTFLMTAKQGLRRLIETRANGQPAFGIYFRDPRAMILHGISLLVLTVSGSRISAMTAFDKSRFPQFGLPRVVPVDSALEGEAHGNARDV